MTEKEQNNSSKFLFVVVYTCVKFLLLSTLFSVLVSNFAIDKPFTCYQSPSVSVCSSHWNGVNRLVLYKGRGVERDVRDLMNDDRDLISTELKVFDSLWLYTGKEKYKYPSNLRTPLLNGFYQFLTFCSSLPDFVLLSYEFDLFYFFKNQYSRYSVSLSHGSLHQFYSSGLR